jgi:hypothetical protein
MNKNPLAQVINFILRAIIRTLCVVDGDFDKVPPIGPFLLAVNHINFMDAPLIASHLHNRPLTVLAKEETWNNPLLGALFSMWGNGCFKGRKNFGNCPGGHSQRYRFIEAWISRDRDHCA